MKAKVEFLGWTKTPTEYEWIHPNGYYNYLITGSNGMIFHYSEWADSNRLLADGEYDLPDAMFNPDDPKWEAENEEIVA